jgi:hypothetical protein
MAAAISGENKDLSLLRGVNGGDEIVKGIVLQDVTGGASLHIPKYTFLILGKPERQDFRGKGIPCPIF